MDRGPVGPARALVRDGGSQLTINYDNDFKGGVNLNATGGFRIGGNTVVSGSLTAAGRNVIAELDALKNRPTVQGAPAPIDFGVLDAKYTSKAEFAALPKGAALDARYALKSEVAAFDRAMNDKQLKLRGAGDGNHYVAYTNNNNIDGARVQGHQGGQLGTNLGGDKTALQWDKDNNVFVNMSTNPLKFSSKWSGFPDGINNGSEISNDTADYKKLMIIGNKSAGAERRVGIWDRLDVHGTLGVDGAAFVGNAFISNDVIMSGDNSWILHTPNDGRKQLYVAPGKDGGNWDWSKQTQFMPDGNIIASGTVDAAGFTVRGQPLATGGGAVDFDAFSNGNNAKFSAGWVVGGESYWDPVVRGPSRTGYAHTDKADDAITSDRTADIQVPAGMKSGFLFHLPWSNCRHFDIWGVLANGKEVFIRRVNAFQNVRTQNTDGLHDSAAIVPIPRVDRFTHIRIKGVRGRIHYMGTGWTKSALDSYASGADSGFVSSQNIMGSALAIGDIPAPQDWTGANFKRRDGQWTHFDWKDDQRNYIRGDTVIDGKVIMNSRTCRNAATGWNDEGGGNAIFLDRHNVECADNEYLTKLKLNRNGKGKFQYDYRCCKFD